MSQLQKGDQVILNSGGPVMTIQRLGDYSRNGGPQNGAECIWFDGSDPKKKTFDVETLKAYVDPDTE